MNKLEYLANQGRTKIHGSMAETITSKLIGIRNEAIKESFSDYFNSNHRLEYVASVHNIDFINDSKAETINSTWFALEEMLRPTIWIAGGDDRDNDYSKINDLVIKKIKAIICIGKDNSRLIENFGPIVKKMYIADTMNEAVIRAFNCSESGDTVLLSPACPPDDKFSSYIERGINFKKSVNKL
ncbi:MAG: cyanophycin synthetase [Bacteroidales bacterium]|jgi:UDP-N-acetylmuramoylalanine--D-glutamate ligase|nr:hypothetical protein [Bacteroidales bacterium]MDD2204079.1 cyanophycin synthetase [Bacteroidales bacterium]MDD3152186.1 cyanophycin synthetase [Bacteroidales bacterium]MDD3913743.1 cyanophycin synthetase [Bacteroidales bacterium]MDD4633508.1 cyanophycin synthetase [Bacteroidales bacterium]